MGRGGPERRTRRIVALPRLSDATIEDARIDAFSDAIVRVVDLGTGPHEPFRLSPRVPVPALDLMQSDHEGISRAHARLLRRCVHRTMVLTGASAEGVIVRVVDLTGSKPHLHALIASLAYLAQATTKQDPTVSIPSSIRDGLIGEGLADAYFSSEGWSSVPGIGAFYRNRIGTFGARLTHGIGLDHLFRRTKSDGTVEYLAVETKVCRSDTSLDGYLRGQFEREYLSSAGAASFAAPPLSPEWIADRLSRAHLAGDLRIEDYEAVAAAMNDGHLRRTTVLVACPDYDRPRRPHVPNPDALQVRTARGPRPLADEVLTLRVPKAVLTTLVGDISNARARSIAAIALKPNSRTARIWRQIDG